MKKETEQKLYPYKTSERRPDYHYKYRGEVHPGYYNENIDEYELHREGQYLCTVHLSASIPAEQAEAYVMERARILYPNLAHLNINDVTIHYMRSVAAAKTTKVKTNTPIVPKRIKVKPNEPVTKITFIAIRSMDGYIEQWAKKEDYMYKYILNRHRIEDCIEFNAKRLMEGNRNIRSYHQAGKRYLFRIEDLERVTGLNLPHVLERPDLTPLAVDKILMKEALDYEVRRRQMNIRNAEYVKHKNKDA